MSVISASLSKEWKYTEIRGKMFETNTGFSTINNEPANLKQKTSVTIRIRDED